MSDDLTARLLTVLRDTTGTPTLEFNAPPERLTGGFWAELLAFRLTGGPEGWDGDLVARVMPEPAVARKETLVQTEVAFLGFATPTVRAAGGPDDGLGRAFMVMDRASGAPLLAGLDGMKALAHLPGLAAAIPETLAATMADLHRLDPDSLRHRLAEDTSAVTTVPAMLDHLRSTAATLGRADLAGAAQWLTDNPPATEAEVICHGDLHPFNLLVDSDGAVTVLDWSAALLGARAYDVAFTALTLAEPPLAVPDPLRPVVRAAGRMLARRFIRRYQRHSGRTFDQASLRWHQAVVCLRALVEVAGWKPDELESRAGHPWVLSGANFAARLSQLTGVTARPASRVA
jgi:aminoglycoside phosphotransferase (APT) family kinase protein